MALGFFRRRQKLVIIIMVVLMVSFLVGSYGINAIVSTDPQAVVIADLKHGELTRGQLRAAQGDLQLLRQIGLGSNPYRYPPWPTEMAFMEMLRRGGERAALTYALLKAEAGNAGVLVGESDVDDFFARTVGSGETYSHFVSALRATSPSWTEQRVRSTVADWLRVHKAFTDAAVSCPPSELNCRVTFRNMQEQISVRLLRLTPDMFDNEVADPNDRRIREHFAAFRTRFEGQARSVNDFGFGYKVPGKARIDYLALRGDVLERVTTPPRTDVEDEFLRNPGRYTKEVVTEATTGPATTQAATGPTRTVPMSFAEARDQIIEELRGQAVSERLDRLAMQVEAEVQRLAQAGTAVTELYPAVRRAVTTSVEKELSAPLKGVRFENLPLAEAVERIAEAAPRVQAICFPWGSHGGETLAPDVEVSLAGEGLTLGAALDELCRQTSFPKLHWAGCSLVRGVLFPVRRGSEGIDFFPLQPGATGMMTFQELADHELLGDAYANPAGGQQNALAFRAFSAKGLARDEGTAPLVQVGKPATRMVLLGETPGRLLWRLMEVMPAHVPTSLEDRPELRKEVIEDLRTIDAFQLAVKDARTIAKTASGAKVNLDTIAAARKVEPVVTGPFARRTITRTGEMLPTEVPGLELARPAVREHVLGEAFKLVPEDVGVPAEQQPSPVRAVPLAIRQEVLVMEREDYEPALMPDFAQFGLASTAQYLNYRQRRIVLASWFAPRAVEARVQAKWRRGD